jgi:hypothetical protein
MEGRIRVSLEWLLSSREVSKAYLEGDGYHGHDMGWLMGMADHLIEVEILEEKGVLRV